MIIQPDAESMTQEELIARARDMVPGLREKARATEQARRLLPETVEAFTQAGFFRITQPRRYGGFELGLDVLEAVVIEVARGCGSSAWALAILSGHSWLTALFDTPGQDAIFGEDGHVIMATNLSGNGRARRVPGGYQLSGRFTYLSGCEAANWLCVGAMVEDAVESPPWLYAALRPQDATIVDDWFVLGLRGTGSKTVLVEDLFVPEHLTLAQAAVQEQAPPGRFIHPNPLYATPLLSFLSIETTGAAVGIALQAVEVLEEIGRSKPNRVRGNAGPPSLLHQTAAFQRRFAEARSLAETARTLLLSEARRLMETVASYAPQGRKLTQAEQLGYTLATARVVDLCVQAVDHAFAVAGTSATVDGHPLERCFRDIHMLSTHNIYRLDQIDERWSAAHFAEPAAEHKAEH